MAIKTFTSGEVLTAADTNTYLANSGLVYITSSAISGATTTVSNCFSSQYDNYRVLITTTASSAAGAVPVYLRPGGANSSYGGSVIRSYGTTVNALANPGDSYLIGYMTTTSHQFSFAGDIFNPNLTVPTFLQFQAFGYNSVDNVNYTGGENLYTTTAYTSLVFGVSSGTATGTITIFGYRKA